VLHAKPPEKSSVIEDGEGFVNRPFMPAFTPNRGTKAFLWFQYATLILSLKVSETFTDMITKLVLAPGHFPTKEPQTPMEESI
jgi:hypothetical protein